LGHWRRRRAPAGNLFDVTRSALHTIRRAQAGDAESVARLFRAVRRACLPYLPDLHTAAEDLAFFRDRVFAACEVWLQCVPHRLGGPPLRPSGMPSSRIGQGAARARDEAPRAAAALGVPAQHRGDRLLSGPRISRDRAHRRGAQRGARARHVDGTGAPLARQTQVVAPRYAAA